MPTILDNEPTPLQLQAIDNLRFRHDTLAIARCTPYGTRTWLAAAFERLDPGDEWQETHRWRILPDGSTYDCLPGTPSHDQAINPPPDEAIAQCGELPHAAAIGVLERQRDDPQTSELAQACLTYAIRVLRGSR